MNCVCGHSLDDHKRSSAGVYGFGECLRCYCRALVSASAPDEVPDISDYTSLGSGAPLLEMIIERLERKGSPQGLNVMTEELQWIGHTSVTYEKILKVVTAELRSPRPRVVAVAEGVYWLADKPVPPGWSLYGKSMLPCFYREYPPKISWEAFESPDNVMPRPKGKASKSS